MNKVLLVCATTGLKEPLPYKVPTSVSFLKTGPNLVMRGYASTTRTLLTCTHEEGWSGEPK